MVKLSDSSHRAHAGGVAAFAKDKAGDMACCAKKRVESEIVRESGKSESDRGPKSKIEAWQSECMKVGARKKAGSVLKKAEAFFRKIIRKLKAECNKSVKKPKLDQCSTACGPF